MEKDYLMPGQRAFFTILCGEEKGLRKSREIVLHSNGLMTSCQNEWFLKFGRKAGPRTM